MQQHQDFIKATSSLANLQKQLALTTSNAFAQKEKEELTTQIEKHFERCCLLLAAREIQLLSEVDQAFKQLQKITVSQLERRIGGCIKAIESASWLYEGNPTASVSILQGVSSVELPKSVDQVQLSLSDSMFKLLSDHGQVSTVFTCSEALEVTSLSKIMEELSPHTPVGGTTPKIRQGYTQTISSIREDITKLSNQLAQISQQVRSVKDSTTTQSQQVALTDAIISKQQMNIDQLTQQITTASNTHARISENITAHETSISKILSQEWLIVGPITTLAGSVPGNSDGVGHQARFNDPFYMCFNPTDDCLYVCDTQNHAIRKITRQGAVSTFIAKDGHLRCPKGITYYQKENCFFVCASEQHTIKRIPASGKISVVAGSGSVGRADGVGTKASFNWPAGITVDQQTGDLFVSDSLNNTIRKITPEGEVSTLAVDGIGNEVMFKGPGGICFDENTNSLIISDGDNGKLRKLDFSTGTLQTMCDISYPSGISITPQGSYIVSDRNTHKVVLVSKQGGRYEVTPLAGSTAGNEDGDPQACKLHHPRGVCFDARTNICYVVDSNNHKIRKFTLNTLSFKK